MTYYLLINSLIGCPYSIELENIIKKHKIQTEINKIFPEEKHLYKNNNISTFPQVFFKKYNSKGSILLGGNSDFKQILNINNKSIEEQLNYLNNKYPNISKKVKLRIIQLFIRK